MDSEEAFDKVEWPRMFQELKETGIKYEDRRVIWNLYRNRKAEIMLGGEVEKRQFKEEGDGFNLYIKRVIEGINDRSICTRS